MTPSPRWQTPKPRGIAGSYGPQVSEWARARLGITFDPWQDAELWNALRHDARGDLVHNTVLWSVARQNGKSAMVRALFGWMLDAGRLLPAFCDWSEMLAAAHDAKQARIPYKGVYRDLARLPEWKSATSGRGSRHKDFRLTEYFGIRAEGLEFDTVTGQPESARGHSAGLIAWDEVLTQTDWEGYAALSPTQMAQRNPLMILTSTAGFADSVVLRTFYDRLVRLSTRQEQPDRSFYGSWYQSEDAYAGLDWRSIRQANPSPRLPRKFVESEFLRLPSEQWRRERLNHWVDVVADAAIAVPLWRRLHVTDPLAGLEGPYFIGVDVQPGWESAAVAVAARRPDGRVGVGIHRDLRAENAPITAESIIAAVKTFPGLAPVVAYEGVIGAAGELDRFGVTDWGTEWRAVQPSKVVAACMDFMQLVQASGLAVDDPLLDAQVQTLARRPVGADGAFRWSRKHSTGPIQAIMAATLAVHACLTAPAYPIIR